MDSRWADLPVLRDTESGIAAIEREQMTKPRPLEVEEPALHQPLSIRQPANNECYPRERFEVDEMTLQSVKLNQYCRGLRVLIQNAKQQVEALKSGDIKSCSFPSIPPLPVCSQPVLKHRLLKPIPFLQNDVDSSFVRGIGHIAPEISHATCRHLLRRSVAVVCAHSSFDTCMESCLDTLSDVVHDYLVRMTQLLRAAVDNDALRMEEGAGGFSDVICRVFYEMGIGSPTVLHDFYQTRIIDYQARLMLTCQQLHQEYSNIVKPDGVSSASAHCSASLKEADVGDIQFPSTEENEEDQVIPLDNFGGNASQESETVLAVEEDSNACVGNTIQNSRPT